MNDLNSVILEGNVVRDATRKDVNGTCLCTFTIATNRYFKKGDDFEKETSFFDIVVWGKLAETYAEKCLKGQGVRVVGRAKQERWPGADGNIRSAIKFVSDHVDFRSKPKTQQGTTDGNGETSDEGNDYDDIPWDSAR